MKMKKKNHDSDSKGKQANPPAESPHRELVTLWSSSKETVRVPAPPGRSRTANLSAEGEGKRLHAGLQELDLELSIGNRIQLSDELIQPRFRHGAVALIVNVDAVPIARRVAVQTIPEADATARDKTGR